MSQPPGSGWEPAEGDAARPAKRRRQPDEIEGNLADIPRLPPRRIGSPQRLSALGESHYAGGDHSPRSRVQMSRAGNREGDDGETVFALRSSVVGSDSSSDW